jgi:choline dehydrogenase-like flavoprotein
VPLSNGSVTVTRRGYPRITYQLGPRDRDNVRRSVEAAARLHLAAGATQVRTLHMVPTIVRSEADLARLRTANYGPNDMQLFSAHVNGTCRMGTNPATSGVGPDGQRFGVRGLYVADGSLLPTAPGVNPQETVMAMASLVADELIG